MSAVIAVDPGATTGYVFATVEDDGDPRFVCNQAGWEEVSDMIWKRLEFATKVGAQITVICERFTITHQTLKNSRQYEALYVIGGLLLMCRHYHHELVLQSPGEAKALITDKRLHRLGWYLPTVGRDHARDALRHLTYWLVTTHRLAATRLR